METEPLKGVNAALAEDTLAFHREIEGRVLEHRTDADYLAHGYAIMPVVGTRQPTSQSALLTDGRVKVSRALPEWMDPLLADGDGTVPRASAIPVELSDAYRDTFVPERHGSLQCNAAVLGDIRGRLEQTQVRGLRGIREPEASHAAAERAAIALDLEDVYEADEPVTILARPVGAGSSGPVRAKIRPVAEAGAAAPPGRTVDFTEGTDGWRLEIPDLEPGLYRVRVG